MEGIDVDRREEEIAEMMVNKSWWCLATVGEICWGVGQGKVKFPWLERDMGRRA